MIIKLSDIYYKKKDILLEESYIDFCKSEIIGIKGANGIGKTTIFNALIDNDQNKFYGGDELLKPNNNDTVLKNILFHTMQYEINETKEMYNLLKLLNFKGKLRDKFNNLSLGNKKKVLLALILSKNAPVYLLDEPFNGLDDETVEILCNLIVKKKNKGKKFIIITHSYKNYYHLFDVIYEFKEKKLIELEHKNQLKIQLYSNSETEKFINIIKNLENINLLKCSYYFIITTNFYHIDNLMKDLINLNLQKYIIKIEQIFLEEGV